MQKKHGRSRTQKFQRFQESDYLDPKHQGLCLGALFDIAATNVSNSTIVHTS